MMPWTQRRPAADIRRNLAPACRPADTADSVSAARGRGATRTRGLREVRGADRLRGVHRHRRRVGEYDFGRGRQLVERGDSGCATGTSSREDIIFTLSEEHRVGERGGSAGMGGDTRLGLSGSASVSFPPSQRPEPTHLAAGDEERLAAAEDRRDGPYTLARCAYLPPLDTAANMSACHPSTVNNDAIPLPYLGLRDRRRAHHHQRLPRPSLADAYRYDDALRHHINLARRSYRCSPPPRPPARGQAQPHHTHRRRRRGRCPARRRWPTAAST
ncbi:hypothetical protein HYPSUDRAFT_1042241 [Hypholoma sublateritium FD-334 SS-4]|uniref:Uncharacterized protein n=1 Tax=Hypholoma sublateritium (strain FD-334 SS-4) TaxID=945553 RepID=A0A0D2P9W9_HYPSF|nr:hypothetical protein HYPSUDRAFT_1042241 [Hypholoma sublateritium FD-334 SS-4]